MKFLKKKDIKNLLYSNVEHKMEILSVILHNKIEDLEESRELAKNLINSDLDTKSILNFLKLLFYYEKKI